MTHKVSIRVSQTRQPNGIVSCKHISLREKLLNKLFGRQKDMLILIPGKSVESMSISESHDQGGAEK